MNGELKRIAKEGVVALQMYYPGISMDELRKPRNASDSRAYDLAKIRSEYQPNRSLGRYGYANRFDSGRTQTVQMSPFAFR